MRGVIRLRTIVEVKFTHVLPSGCMRTATTAAVKPGAEVCPWSLGPAKGDACFVHSRRSIQKVERYFTQSRGSSD